MSLRTNRNPPPTIHEGDLRTWHITNGCTPFHVYVGTETDAVRVLNLLADYDNHLGDETVTFNAQGLEIYHDGQWEEWSDEEGREIGDIR